LIVRTEFKPDPTKSLTTVDHFTYNLACNENLPLSPRFNHNFIQKPQKVPQEKVFSGKECRFSTYEPTTPIKEEEEPIKPLKIEARGIEMKTPSPGQKYCKRIELDSMNSFSGKNGSIENIIARREVSFGAGHLNSNESYSKKRYEEEEEEFAAKSKKKICCNCKKSKCLKLYCDCFAKGEFCGKDCNCVNCANNEVNSEERQSAMSSTLDKNPNAFRPKVDKAESPGRVKIVLFKLIL
jgi:hypothetical protein